MDTRFRQSLQRISFITFTAVAASLAAPGCSEHASISRLADNNRTFHQNFHLRAEDFFQDAGVIKLCQAIELDDTELILRLINDNVDINACGRDNVTPLLWAYPDNKIERFKLLLKAGADPNIKLTGDLGIPAAFKPGESVTLKSAKSFFPEHFFAVMEHGGDPNITDHRGNPILHEMISAGAGNTRNRLKTLIESGADINSLSHIGRPAPITAIAAFQQYDVALLLIDLGCDHTIPQQNTMKKLIHSVVQHEFNLHHKPPEVQASHQRLLKRLTDLGEDPEQARKDNERWANPFLYSVQPSDPRYHIRKEMELRERIKNDPVEAFRHTVFITDKRTRDLHRFIRKPRDASLQNLQSLIGQGAKIDYPLNTGETPAMASVRLQKFSLATALVRAGADLSLPRMDRNTGRPTRLKLVHYVDRYSESIEQFPPEQQQAFYELVDELAKRGERLEDVKNERHFWDQPLVD